MGNVYDLGPKFDALAAFCGTAVSDSNIGALLFADLLEGDRYRQAISRIKAGERPLGPDDAAKLCSHFNQLIEAGAHRNNSAERGAALRPEDWSRPLTEFFREIERQYRTRSDDLDRAHAAIVAALTALDDFRDITTPLALTHDMGAARERARFPTASRAVDTITLPVVQFRHGESMRIELVQPIERASQGWLFFVRNPDIRSTLDGPQRIWTQDPGDLIRWVPSPFPLDAGFFGPLPGFPCPVQPLDGEYTAYFFIEDAQALGMRRCLETEMGRPWNPLAPSYEPTLHLIARARTLFQRGNTGNVPYRPPTLLMRRYRVSA